MSSAVVKTFALLRTAVVAALFIALQVWYLPRWFRISGDRNAPWQTPLRWMGLIPVAAGVALMLACVWRFGVKGEGTPAPFDPPRRLVIQGPYRYVRNPMYWGMGFFLVGEAVLFADPALRLVFYGAALVIVVNLFVHLYEEPTLRRSFGADYGRYCAEVPRWFPRWRKGGAQ
jgi:protein-S-isoprenylcysteine O-methyltransferase Ste14